MCRVNRWYQSQLAEHLGVTHPMITYYRTGKKEPSKEVMERVERLNEEARSLEQAGKDPDKRLRGADRLPSGSKAQLGLSGIGNQKPVAKRLPKSKVLIQIEPKESEIESGGP